MSNSASRFSLRRSGGIDVHHVHVGRERRVGAGERARSIEPRFAGQPQFLRAKRQQRCRFERLHAARHDSAPARTPARGIDSSRAESAGRLHRQTQRLAEWPAGRRHAASARGARAPGRVRSRRVMQSPSLKPNTAPSCCPLRSRARSPGASRRPAGSGRTARTPSTAARRPQARPGAARGASG